MRRVLAFLAVLLLALLLVWFALGERDPFGMAGGGSAAQGTGPDDEGAAEDAKSPRGRDRAKKGERPRAAEDVGGFLGQWPEIAQDREQDPALGWISGRVLVAPGQAPPEAVIEATVRGEAVARARLRGSSEFFLMNVPPGPAVSVTARAEGYAPGGVDQVAVSPGKVTLVGAIYVGYAIDPDVDNHVVVEVTAGGKPVAGARVTATSVYYGSLVSLGPYEKQPGGTVARAVTGPDGRVEFPRLPPAAYDFFAEADGYAFEVRARQVVQKSTRLTVALGLSPAQTIEGRVLTAEGAPAPDVRIVVLRFGNFANYPGTITDAEGKFRIGGLTGGSYMLVFAKEGVGSKEKQNVAAGTKDVEVTLEAGGEIWLRCTDAATGAPVLQFGVRPYRKIPFGYLFAPLFDAKTTDGVYRTRVLPMSDYGAEISADGYTLLNLTKLPVNPAEPVDLKLEPAGVVRGRVVSRLGAKPVRGAQVFVKRGGFPPSRVKDQQTVTGPDGTFTLDRLPRTPISITILHVDHDEATFDAVEPSARQPGGALPEPREFALGSGGRIEGRIVASNMVPEAGTTVQLLVGFDFLNARSTTTDADGRYVFDHVPLGNKYTVNVGRTGPGGGGRNRTDVAVSEDAATVVDFVPEGGGRRLTGRATRGDKPADGINVNLVSDDGGQFTGNERAGRDGVFVFENVPPGRYVVSAQGAKAQTVTVPADGAAPEVVLAVSSAFLSGKVVDATTGQPLGGVFVDCEQLADTSGAALPDLLRRSRGARPADGDGTFTFRSLEDGTYQVRAVRDGYGSEIVDGIVLANGVSREGIVLRLGPACTVSGTVKNAQGMPVEGAALSVRDSKGRRTFAVAFSQSSGDGTYSQGSLRPDTYELTFEKDGYAPTTLKVDLAAAAQVTADVVLLMGGRIEVIVKLADGSPVKDAVVSLWDAAGKQVTRGLTLQTIFSTNRTRTDANGQVVLSGVAPGVYRVTAQAPGRDTIGERTNVEALEGVQSAAEIVVP